MGVQRGLLFVDRLLEAWRATPFAHLDAANLTLAATMLQDEIRAAASQAPPSAIAQLRDALAGFRAQLPLVEALCNRAMGDRHWTQLSELLGHEFRPKPTMTLSSILEMGLAAHFEALQRVGRVATREYIEDMAFRDMMSSWEHREIALVEAPRTEGLRGTEVTYMLDEIVAQDLQALVSVRALAIPLPAACPPLCDAASCGLMRCAGTVAQVKEHLVRLQMIQSSKEARALEQSVVDFEARLRAAQALLDAWLVAQAAWVGLRPVLSSGDIAKQLPTEARRFAELEAGWRANTTKVLRDRSVLAVSGLAGLLESFHAMHAAFEEIHGVLSGYIERKRVAFPRFYFCPQNELLAFLSQGSISPLAVKPILRKVFEGIRELELQPDFCMTAMISVQGERVPFKTSHYPEGPAGMWLGQVQREMEATVQEQILLAVEGYRSSPRGEWVLRWPSQVVIAGSALFWAREVEGVLSTKGSAGLAEYKHQMTDQLDELTRIISGALAQLQRVSVGALLTIEVHARDVVLALGHKGVEDVGDWEWIGQLRYELCEGGHPHFAEQKKRGTSRGSDEARVLVKQMGACFQYANEYLGASNRLVLTPLTDKIYLTLTGALQLYAGGAPMGPAGVGKTETVKDLAKALAKQCLIFNCGPEFDYRTMGDIFKGLASLGSWGCFDEFNRIDLEVLSVVAQQVASVQQAMQAGLKRFTFEGQEISLDDTTGVFMTMNPGYAGRNELPETLSALLRPVACQLPDVCDTVARTQPSLPPAMPVLIICV